jgi:cell division septation protein DedD
VPAQVQRVTINNQDTYHRLRAGPFTDRKEMDEIRRRLRKSNVDSVLVRWKN